MRLIYLLFLLFVSIEGSAQVCITRKGGDGMIRKGAWMKLGKDTIVPQMGLKRINTPGLILVFLGQGGKTFLSYQWTIDESILKDTINAATTSLLVSLNNKDTISVKPLINKLPWIDYEKSISPGVVSVSYNYYLSDDQLRRMQTSTVMDFRLYLNDHVFISQAVTDHEKDKFKTIMNYLLK